MSEIIQVAASRETANPKTVLGFYAGFLVIVSVSIIGASISLAATNVATWVIPWLLAFLGVIFVGTIAGVFVLNIKSPSKLMLGQITGNEYAMINRINLGDSLGGERTVLMGGNQQIATFDDQGEMGVESGTWPDGNDTE